MERGEEKIITVRALTADAYQPSAIGPGTFLI
jgi:hypothetical protein